MASTETKKLADRIAKILESEPQPADLASLYASVEKLNHRLAKLENSLNPKSEIRKPQTPHPSVEKFGVAEAVAEDIFIGLQKEKACTFEPNGKPCDHCAMCSSRGF